MPARSSARCSAGKASSARVGSRADRGTYGKTVVFGIFERQGQVYAKVKSTPRSSRTGQRGKAAVGWSEHGPDSWRGGPVDLGYGRVDHSRDQFANGAVHGGDSPKSGWRSSRACPGAPSTSKRTFHLHLKETGTTMPTGPDTSGKTR